MVFVLFSQQVYGVLRLVGQVISVYRRNCELCKHVT